MNTGFSFPGFTQLRHANNPTHEVIIGKLEIKDQVFILHLVRNVIFTFSTNFVLSEVWNEQERKRLWRFKDLNFNGNSFIARIGDEIVIALVRRGKQGDVERIIPFTEFFHSRNPTDLRKLISLKKLSAKSLGRGYQLNEVEKRLVKFDQLRNCTGKNKYDSTPTEHQIRVARDNRAAIKAHRAIMKARLHIGEISEAGKIYHGIPVTEAEWQSLLHGTYIFFVENYDLEKGGCSKYKKFFWVQKNNSNMSKEGPVRISFKHISDTDKSAMLGKPISTMSIELDSNVLEVYIFDTFDALRQVIKSGSIEGKYVTSKDRISDVNIEIFSVISADLKPAGNLTLI